MGIDIVIPKRAAEGRVILPAIMKLNKLLELTVIFGGILQDWRERCRLQVVYHGRRLGVGSGQIDAVIPISKIIEYRLEYLQPLGKQQAAKQIVKGRTVIAVVVKEMGHLGGKGISLGKVVSPEHRTVGRGLTVGQELPLLSHKLAII